MVDSLKNLVKCDHWKVPTSQKKLEETDPNSKMEVTLSNMPNDYLVIKLPSDPHLNVINPHKVMGCRKSCDYLVLTNRGTKLDAYFIELKKTSKQDTLIDAYTQITNTMPVLAYLCKMVEVHFQKIRSVKSHFIVIVERSSPRLDKQAIKPTPCKTTHHNGKKFKIIYSAKQIPFDALK